MEEQNLPQSKTTIIFAVIFLGLLGVHRKMMGYKLWWLQLITLGGLGIWTFIDFILIVSGKLKMADGEPLLTGKLGKGKGKAPVVIDESRLGINRVSQRRVRPSRR